MLVVGGIEDMNIAKKAVKILREEGVAEFARKLLKYMKYHGILFFPYALFKIKYFCRDHDVNELIGFAFDEFGGIIEPVQIQDEILELLRRLKNRKPKVVVEIGTAKGGTLFLFSRLASEDATIISIDLPGGGFGGGYPKWKIPLYKSFARKKQKIHLIRENSHSDLTLEKVKTLLSGKYIDFLFIDGDHSYYGINKDFEMYRPLVRKGGIIAFHEIVPGPKEGVGGVPEFWREIKDNYENEEIVKDWGQDWGGIGIIYV